MTRSIYHLEPMVIQSGPLRIVGAEDLFVQRPGGGQIGADGKTQTGDLYKRLNEIRNPVNPCVSLGIQRVGPSSKGLVAHDQFYHMAAYEVERFEDIPHGMVGKVVPPSKYLVYSCESAVDEATGQPSGSLDWEALFPKVFFDPDALYPKQGVKDRGWYIEISHYADNKAPGFPLTKFEIRIAIE